MKRKALLTAFGLTVSVLSALFATETQAQTISNGPYYAQPSWDQSLPPASRFIVLANFNNEAVLDRETGLVWERSPSTTLFAGRPDPLVIGGEQASNHCVLLRSGNRLGWRLPSVQELLSLVDPAQPSAPKLPAGHPFINVQTGPFDSIGYWSATVDANPGENGIWAVYFGAGIAGTAGTSGGTIQFPVWCVRTGSGSETQ